MKKPLVEKYFSEDCKAWITASYESDGYTFPTALSRVGKTISILTEQFPDADADIVDLGCGGGQLCLKLAEMGHRVTGIEESEAMLCEALKARATMPETVQSRVRFVQDNLLENRFESCAFDAVTALGVIGYLASDEILFKEAARLLRPNGIFVVSCRNRLFNMISISDYTAREIEQGTAQELITEIRELFQQIPEQDAMNFLTSLASIANAFLSDTASRPKDEKVKPEVKFTTSVEARQHTPKGLLASATACGFQDEGFYGVHPHLLMASVNRLLPPDMFNILSSSLEALDHLSVSLIWSSVFIGVFRKSL
jgi:2-polyprenyl-3-methyl-5-hydroxy-6-metoxy-1,4-benzoquinol methylase